MAIMIGTMMVWRGRFLPRAALSPSLCSSLRDALGKKLLSVILAIAGIHVVLFPLLPFPCRYALFVFVR